MSGTLSLPGWQSTRGTSSPNAKLTDARVRFIRRTSLSTTTIARVLGVNYETVRKVRLGRSYCDV